MSKVYGKKVTLGKYPCRFPDIQDEKADGGYQVEILVPIKEAKAVQDALYNDDENVINFNKATPQAKVPKKLYNPVYLYDDENKCPVLNEEGEKVESDEVVLFRFKSQFRPKIQFKKGLDATAKIGAGSVIQVNGAIFGSDEKKDENGKPVKYVLLSLYGVRVHELVEKTVDSEVFEEDDDFEDEFSEEESQEETEEKPKAKPKAKNKDF